MTKNKPNKAFSLIELSITIVIIGLLILGVIGSKHLVNKARINSAQAITRSSVVNGIVDNKLWLESSLDEVSLGKGLSTGDSLITWLDNSPNKTAIEITVEGTGPTYSNSINSVQAVKFDADSNSNYLRINSASFLNDTDYTIFITEKRVATNSSVKNYLLGESGSFGIGYESDTTIIQTHSESASSDNQASIEPLTSYSNKPRVLTFTHSSTDGNKIYINATLANEDTTSNAKTHLTGITTLAIGKGFNGEIGEIIIFDRDLKTIERQDVEDYLSDKWNAPNNRESVPSCSTGTILSSGCDPSCSAPSVVNGITSTTVIVEGEDSSYACDAAGYTGNTPSYTCTSGVLSPTPLVTHCTVNLCEAGYTVVANACTQGCTVDTIIGTSASGTTVTDTTAVTCDETGYDSTTTLGTCSAGNTISGSCGCDTANNYTDSDSDGVCEASCSITAANSGLPSDLTVLSGSTSYDCSGESGYGGTLAYTCSDGTPGTPTAKCVDLSDPFTTTWSTTSADETITLPLVSGGTYNFVVDWGDDDDTVDDHVTTYDDSEITHTYATAGSHEVNIYGTMTGWAFNDGGDKTKITGITHWGQFKNGNESGAFKGCSNLASITATDTPDLSSTTSIATMFWNATSLSNIDNVASWNVSNITNFSGLFINTDFNQDIGGWNVSNGESFQNMFYGNSDFDQDLSSWVIGSATNLSGMLLGATLSTTNYNKLLNSFATQAANAGGSLNGLTFHGGNSTYDTSTGGVDGTAARNLLTGTYSWTITADGGELLAPLDCSGGSKTASGGNNIHVFTSSGSLTSCTGGSNEVRILLVGGGGGGGNGNDSYPGGGGGGGGGQVLDVSDQSLSAGNSLSVVVGGSSSSVSSCASSGNRGNSSTVSGVGVDLTAYGGWGGGGNNTASGDTTSPGGGSGTYGGGARGLGTQPGGFGGGNGSRGGGGGGSTANVGSSASVTIGGDGANGQDSDITGINVTYGGGGGGGGRSSSSSDKSSGGSGGGGGGAHYYSTYTSASSKGTANTGGGGGGGMCYYGSSKKGSTGGSGIVIISYPNS